jgi:hypothetical protein
LIGTPALALREMNHQSASIQRIQRNALAYKNDVFEDSRQPAEEDLDAVQLWCRIFLCPLIVPCLFCTLLCTASDASSSVAPEQDAATVEPSQEEPDSLWDRTLKTCCSCLIEYDDIQAHTHGGKQSIINATPRQSLRRRPLFTKTKTYAALTYELAINFARTDRLIAKPEEGLWYRNTFYPGVKTEAEIVDDEDKQSDGNERDSSKIDGARACNIPLLSTELASNSFMFKSMIYSNLSAVDNESLSNSNLAVRSKSPGKTAEVLHHHKAQGKNSTSPAARTASPSDMDNKRARNIYSSPMLQSGRSDISRRTTLQGEYDPDMDMSGDTFDHAHSSPLSFYVDSVPPTTREASSRVREAPAVMKDIESCIDDIQSLDSLANKEVALFLKNEETRGSGAEGKYETASRTKHDEDKGHNDEEAVSSNSIQQGKYHADSPDSDITVMESHEMAVMAAGDSGACGIFDDTIPFIDNVDIKESNTAKMDTVNVFHIVQDSDRYNRNLSCGEKDKLLHAAHQFTSTRNAALKSATRNSNTPKILGPSFESVQQYLLRNFDDDDDCLSVQSQITLGSTDSLVSRYSSPKVGSYQFPYLFVSCWLFLCVYRDDNDRDLKILQRQLFCKSEPGIGMTMQRTFISFYMW